MATMAPDNANMQEVNKAANAVMSNLALLYKACHKADPNSAACQAVQSIMMAVSEIEKSLGLPTDDDGSQPEKMNPNDPDYAIEGAEAEHQPGGSDPQQIPTDGGFGKAAGDTRAMMQAAAKRRAVA